jgi:cystathionine beta-lyase
MDKKSILKGLNIMVKMMNNFDKKKQDYQDNFIRSNPEILKNFFGVKDVKPFWIADMDFEIAQPIKDELQRLVDRNIFAYEFDKDKIFTSITEWYMHRHNLELSSENFIQVNSVLTGISLLIRELSEPNDGVLIQTPVYHQFVQTIKSANRKIVTNPLKNSKGLYTMDYEDFNHKCKTQNVKLMILCNPQNPVGRVWNKDELEKLVKIAHQYKITIISDEIHSDIIYSGKKFNSFVSVSKDNHIALLGSPAKTFGMQSIANGYIYIPNEKIWNKISQTASSLYLDHSNVFSTYATIAAYTYGSDWLDDLTNYLENTISWIQEYLNKELPQIKMSPVEGTYQIWLDFSELRLNKEALSDLVFKKAKLGLTPGQWFGKDSSMNMRMNIASPLSKIKDALIALKEAVNEPQ